LALYPASVHPLIDLEVPFHEHAKEKMMDAIDLLKFSVGNAFGILSQVTADLTQEQADWVPPGLANPIGATYWHTVSSADFAVFQWCAGQTPMMESAGWREKALLASAPESEHETREHMLSIQVDLPALHAYAAALAEALQEWLSSLTAEELGRVLETPVGELALGQMLEMFVIWHINAHCGEISALKGCLGVKGYPF
jgi:hypothetical protein